MSDRSRRSRIESNWKRRKGSSATSGHSTMLVDRSRVFSSSAVHLDSQAAKSIFKSVDMVRFHRKHPRPFTLGGIDAKGTGLRVTTMGSFRDLGPVGLHEQAVANILSQSEMVDAGHEVTYVTKRDEFVVTTTTGSVYVFKRRHGSSHYTWEDNHDTAMVATVKMNKVGFSVAELRSAEEARNLLEKTGCNAVMLKRILAGGSILNCPVTCGHVDMAQAIYGKSMTELKGRTVKKVSIAARSIDRKGIHPPSTVEVDIMFIEGQSFLVGVMLPLNHLSALHLKHRTAKCIAHAISYLVAMCKSRGFDIEQLRTDNEGGVVAYTSELGRLGITVDPCGPGQHCPHVERAIRVIKERVRGRFSTLPFLMCIKLIRLCVTFVVKKRNWECRVGEESPQLVFGGRKMDAKIDLRGNFGDYVQATSPTTGNTMQPRTQGFIYGSPTGGVTGSVVMYCVATGAVMVRDQFTHLPMPDTVVDLLTKTAVQQGITRVHDPLSHAEREDLDGEVREDDDADDNSVKEIRAVEQPVVGDGVIEALHEKSEAEERSAAREELLGHQSIPSRPSDAESDPPEHGNDTSEPRDQDPPHEDAGGGNDDAVWDVDAGHLDGGEADGDQDQATEERPSDSQHRDGEPHTSSMDPVDEAVWKSLRGISRSDMTPSQRAHSIRLAARMRERLTGHALVARTQVGPTSSFDSDRHGAKSGQCMVFHVSIRAAMRDRPQDALPVATAELSQMIKKKVFHPILASSLTSPQRKGIIRSSMFFKEKFHASGAFEKYKARLVAGGNNQDKDLYENLSSPTAATSSVLTVAAIAANEGRKVITMDIGGAFLNSDITRTGVPVYMTLNKDMASILMDLDPGYVPFVSSDGKVVVKLDKALYGCVEAAALWYEDLSGVMVAWGLVINPHDPCVFNRTKQGVQITVALHVDDLLITSKSEDLIQDLQRHIRKSFAETTTKVGRVIDYVGMTFDFEKEGEVSVTMNRCVSEILQTCGVSGHKNTPASDMLFVPTDDTHKDITAEEHAWFRTYVAKLLYLSKRARPECLTAVSYLTTRVLVTNRGDLGKLHRILMYIRATPTRGVVLRIGGDMRVSTYIDAAYGVHSGGKSQTGATMVIGDAGPVRVKAARQKIVTKSSTEAELVAVSDEASMSIYMRNFLICQGYTMGPSVIYQDNMSCMALIARGRPAGEKSRHIDLRYFWLKERVDSGEVIIVHLGTAKMFANILTKPVQGNQFKVERKGLSNWPEDISTSTDKESGEQGC